MTASEWSKIASRIRVIFCAGLQNRSAIEVGVDRGRRGNRAAAGSRNAKCGRCFGPPWLPRVPGLLRRSKIDLRVPFERRPRLEIDARARGEGRNTHFPARNGDFESKLSRRKIEPGRLAGPTIVPFEPQAATSADEDFFAGAASLKARRARVEHGLRVRCGVGALFQWNFPGRYATPLGAIAILLSPDFRSGGRRRKSQHRRQRG